MTLTRSIENVVVGCPRWWKRRCEGECNRVKMMPFGTLVCPFCEEASNQEQAMVVRRAYRLFPLPSLQRVRSAQGFSRRRLAAVCGISRATVNNIESGRHRTRYATARLLAAALGVTVEDLQRDEPRAPGVGVAEPR